MHNHIISDIIGDHSLIYLSEMPHIPGNVQVLPYTSFQILQTPFSVHWSAPDNIHRFDLDYYQVKVTTLATSQENPREYYLNTTSTVVEYPFGLLLNSTILRSRSVNMAVSAVSRCSQQGPPSNHVIAPYTGSTMMSSMGNQIDLNTAGNGTVLILQCSSHNDHDPIIVHVYTIPSHILGFKDSKITLYKGTITMMTHHNSAV